MKYLHVLISETGSITEMDSGTTNSGMMSFGWGMSTFIPYSQKVGHAYDILHTLHPRNTVHDLT